MKSNKRCYSHTEWAPGADCQKCKKVFDNHLSICANCGREVTNSAFFKRTSPHFKATCKPEPWSKIEDRTVDKPLPYPMPSMAVDYSSSYIVGAHIRQWPQTIEELRQFWGMDKDSTTTETHARLIELLQEQNRLLRQLAA